jgi:hypothetical protein
LAIYQYKTFADIYTAVLESAKIQSGDSESVKRIKRHINGYYMNEVVPRATWPWLRDSLDISLEAKATGTCAVTAGSTTLTLSAAPTGSRKGHLIAVQGCNEVYRIAQHTADATTITLATPYTGSTSAAVSYTSWNDRLALPVDCKETTVVRHDFDDTPLEGVGYERLVRLMAQDSQAQGNPVAYSTTDYVDPAPYGAIASLPATTYRASSGLVKTLVFAANVSTYLAVGDRVEISAAGHYSYNGRWVVSALSTTTLTNDTITFTGLVPYAESSTADASTSVQLLSQETALERHRQIILWPAVVDTRLTLHVDYERMARPLEDDDDEPLLPLEDRAVLVYAGQAFAWGSLNRNPEEEAKYMGLCETKLGRMAGKVSDSLDYPRIVADPGYLASKRRRNRVVRSFTRND